MDIKIICKLQIWNKCQLLWVKIQLLECLSLFLLFLLFCFCFWSLVGRFAILMSVSNAVRFREFQSASLCPMTQFPIKYLWSQRDKGSCEFINVNPSSPMEKNFSGVCCIDSGPLTLYLRMEDRILFILYFHLSYSLITLKL